MRRSASEIIRNLESRIARLEKQSSREETLKSLSTTIAKDLSKLSGSRVRSNWVEDALYDFFLGIEGFFDFDIPEDTPDDLDIKVLGYRSINLAGDLIVEVKCTMDRPRKLQLFGVENYVHKMTFQVIYDHKEIEVKEA
jgi:hypothetical protein